MENEKLKNIIAKNLSHFRKLSGLTQTELAEKLNYSDKSVSKWERAEGFPDIIVLENIARIFGVTLNDLVDENSINKKKIKFYLPVLSGLSLHLYLFSCQLF